MVCNLMLSSSQQDACGSMHGLLSHCSCLLCLLQINVYVADKSVTG